MSDRDKDAEILALRHQLAVLQRQLGSNRAKFAPEDRAFLAALLKPLPRESLRRLHLIVSPDTVLRWCQRTRQTGSGASSEILARTEYLTTTGILHEYRLTA